MCPDRNISQPAWAIMAPLSMQNLEKSDRIVFIFFLSESLWHAISLRNGRAAVMKPMISRKLNALTQRQNIIIFSLCQTLSASGERKPRQWSMSNFSCSLSRNITSHSMKNLAFHSLLRWKLISLPILTTSHFSLKGWENILFLGVKGLIWELRKQGKHQ